MMQTWMNDPLLTKRVLEIARNTLDGKYDPLLACRDLATLRERLPRVTHSVMNIFVGIASEVDALPIGSERQHWAAAPLRLKDIEAAEYRERVQDVVANALRELVLTLENDRRGA